MKGHGRKYKKQWRSGDGEHSMKIVKALFTAALFAAALHAQGEPARVKEEPIRFHRKNPHYFLFRGKAIALITSGEHYGAVLNANVNGTAAVEWRKVNLLENGGILGYRERNTRKVAATIDL